MKKLFEKPVMDVLFFDEEDIISVSNGFRETSSDAVSNAERAADGLNTSVITVERASSIIGG